MFFGFWLNRSLIWQMLKRDIAQRYQGSIIGVAWSFITPLLMLLVYTFVFSVVFKARWEENIQESKIDFALLLFVGMIVFGVFSEMVNRAPSLILSNISYVKKVVFPLEILTWISLGSVIFHSAVSVIVLLVLQLVNNFFLPWTVILFPLVLSPLFLWGIGFSWLISALAVYIRDIGQVTGVFTTILMFLSAIFYPVAALPEEFQFFIRANPLAVIIEQSRKVLIYGQQPNWYELAAVFIVGFIVAWFGFWGFQKARKGFADVL